MEQYKEDNCPYLKVGERSRQNNIYKKELLCLMQ